jgi:hypothetical protein
MFGIKTVLSHQPGINMFYLLTQREVEFGTIMSASLPVYNIENP